VAKSRLDFSRKDKILTRNSSIKVENEKDSAQFLKKRNKKSESDEIPFAPQSPEQSKSVKRKRKVEGEKTIELSKKRNGKDESVKVSFAPTSPDQSETKKRKRKYEVEKTVVTRARAARKEGKIAKVQYYKKVVYDGGEFEVGDDVYVKRRDDATSDEEDPEVEDCKLCFSSGDEIMIECDSCLGGFHLKCLTPPLKEVPEGDWICGICEGRKMGKDVDFPKPPEGKKIVRTMRQKLHSSDLWAARIERYDILYILLFNHIMICCFIFILFDSNHVDADYGVCLHLFNVSSIWKEVDGSYWCRVRWYMIPEETSVGRQPHNLSRELYRTNDFANIEVM
jgi:origin recognition complex subunit 1